MEKETAIHSSILAWKSPWTEKPGGLQSIGLHDWACVHEGGGAGVGSNKLVELKKEKKGLYSQNCGFSTCHVRMWVGPKRRLSTEELMFLSCGAGEDSWEFLGLQEDQTSQS